MSEYDHTYLEKDGTIVAYFAPGAEVNVVYKSDLKNRPLPERINKVIDNQIVNQQITIQGFFKDSSDLPQDHKNALETLFSESPVTSEDQINRIKYYQHLVGSPFELYHADAEYTASSVSGLDYNNQIFPKVNIDEGRFRRVSGQQHWGYTIKFVMGVR